MMNLAKVLAMIGAIVSFPMCAIGFQMNEEDRGQTKIDRILYHFIRYGTMALPAMALVFAIYIGVEL